jgi:putative transposase
MDLYSCRVIGWSMHSRQTTDVVLQALLMAVWRRGANKVYVCGRKLRQYRNMKKPETGT